MDDQPPAKRKGPPRSETYAEQGKPIVLPEAESTATATRVRLVLNPGQIAGLDGEEGYSVNLTCGESAKTMLVDFGNRERLMALQALALPDDLTTSSPVH
jgi:hypothetical protein